MKKKVGVVICMAAVVFSILQGLYELRFFHEWGKYKHYKLETKVTMETVKAIKMADEIPDMVFWSFFDQEMISASIPAERMSKVSVIVICGNPQYLVGNFGIPQDQDTENCLLDEKTAWKLFGTRNAVGESVEYEGKTYKVKGILDHMEPTMVIQVPIKYEKGFDRITMPIADKTGDWELENRMWNKYGMVMQKIHWGMVRNAVKLLFCGMILFAYCVCVKKICRYRMKKKLHRKNRDIWICVAVGILLLSILPGFAGMYSFSAENIPAQWSDFGFYKKMWNDTGAGFKNLLRLNLSTFELKIVLNSIVLCIDAILIGMMGWRLFNVSYDTLNLQ